MSDVLRAADALADATTEVVGWSGLPSELWAPLADARDAYRAARDAAPADEPTEQCRIALGEVRERVAAIEADRYDDETAHGREDSLWESVLQHIADGGPDGQALAAEALKTRDIDFARWCA